MACGGGYEFSEDMEISAPIISSGDPQEGEVIQFYPRSGRNPVVRAPRFMPTFGHEDYDGIRFTEYDNLNRGACVDCDPPGPPVPPPRTSSINRGQQVAVNIPPTVGSDCLDRGPRRMTTFGHEDPNAQMQTHYPFMRDERNYRGHLPEGARQTPDAPVDFLPLNLAPRAHPGSGSSNHPDAGPSCGSPGNSPGRAGSLYRRPPAGSFYDPPSCGQLDFSQ